MGNHDGLSICKSLIETMMKGKIQLESQENVGTTAWFTVTFDRARPEVVAGDAQTKAVSLPESQPRSSLLVDRLVPRELSPNPFTDLSQVPKEELRICIAEDNAINAKIAIQYLSRLGYPNVDSMITVSRRWKVCAPRPRTEYPTISFSWMCRCPFWMDTRQQRC